MYRLPLIFIFSFVMRGVFLYVGFTLFKYFKLTGPLTWQQIVFITIGGVRGSLSLVLAAAISATAGEVDNFDETAQVWRTPFAALLPKAHIRCPFSMAADMPSPSSLTLLRSCMQNQNQMQEMYA